MNPNITPRGVNNPFRHFCMSIGAIPTSYKNALDYYETLLWLIKYLENTVIPAVDNNAEALEELQGLFVTLKDYVVHYFDNLDVQDEINNKLDEMVSDGTLTNLIKAYVDPIYQDYENSINNTISIQNGRITNIENELESVASGSPLVASSTSEMTDTTRVYVNTTDGKWYYYDGDSWEIGGTYQAAEDSTTVNNLSSMISLIEPTNKFNKNECVVGKYVSGQLNETIHENTNNSFAYIILDFPSGATFTCTGNSYYCYLLSDEDEILSIKGNPSTDVSPYSVTNNVSGATKLALNFKPSLYPVNSFMIVSGDSLPEEYSPYFAPYVQLNYAPHYATFPDLDNYVLKSELPELNVYTVGVDKDYTGLIDCLEALENDTSEKIIYIDAGEYDIFDEIGGSAFALAIEDGTNWQDVSVFVPPNTKIIGIGKVILKFEPSAAQIGSIASNLLSPLNVAGTCHIENIDIIADNCRYCIHDETSGDIQYTGAKKTYKNVRCIKKRTDNLGYAQAYASGFDDNMVFEFDNCIFESYSLPFSVHNRDTANAINSSKIYANNCAFICGSSSDTSVRLGNINWHSEEIPVELNNCYLNKQVHIYPETNYGKQNYNLTMIGCSDVTIDIDLKDGDTNTFEPTILQI